MFDIWEFRGGNVPSATHSWSEQQATRTLYRLSCLRLQFGETTFVALGCTRYAPGRALYQPLSLVVRGCIFECGGRQQSACTVSRNREEG